MKACAIVCDMAAPTELSRSSDASFLRRLLEPQAACLVRVRLDGVLLACNQAALGLFGVAEQRAILNSNLIDRLVPAERTQWHEFVAQCSAASSPDNSGTPLTPVTRK